MDRTVLKKAASYCAYQERTQNDVRERLGKWGVWGDDADEIISELILQNYLNEERFSKAFAGGKFRTLHWGKKKIELELLGKGLSKANISIGLREISDDDYLATLTNLLTKKRESLGNSLPNKALLKARLVEYALRKGYETDLVWQVVRELLGK